MPRKKLPPVEDSYIDQPIRDDAGQPSDLTMPVQQMTRLTRDPGRGMMPSTGSRDPGYARWLEGRDLDELKMALAHDSSPKVVAFLGALVDPRHINTDITTLAKLHSIGLTEMMQVWRSYRLTDAIGIHIDGAPAIASDVVIDARSTLICCPRCDGAGMIKVNLKDGQEWKDCPQCSATGSVRKVGDSKARDLVYQTIGFTKAGGLGINVNIQNTSNTVESVIDELDRLSPAIPVESIAIPLDDS